MCKNISKNVSILQKIYKEKSRIIYTNSIYKMTTVIHNFKIIKNIMRPICAECVFYKEVAPKHTIVTTPNCERYGTKDLITGNITYGTAKACRLDASKCGNKGRGFKKDIDLANYSRWVSTI